MRFRNVFLSALVFISGGAVLAVEILGTRLLGPFYGVSLFLWSALITVTLLALSVGYAVGGRIADRGPKLDRLCLLLVGAGAWLLVLPSLRNPVLQIAEPFGMRFAVLVASLLLFGPPLTLLGMVSPYAIRLRASSLGEVGRTAGDLYALSTVGSVLAAVLTGFLLIPYMGVRRLTFLVGLVLLAVALIGLLSVRRRGASGAVAGLLLAGVLLSAGSGSERPDPELGILSIEHSPYAEIRVVDHQDTRYMLIDGGTHTIVDASTLESYFPYVHVVDMLNNVMAEPGELLLVGLGGGSVARLFARQEWSVDAVEIDPVVTRIAQRDFGLEPSDARVFHDDGRHYLMETDKLYDAIVLDAFGSSSIPFHLITREAFELTASRLAPEGVLAINIECIGWDDMLVGSLTATLREVFPHVLALPIAEPPDALGNLVLYASWEELDLAHEMPPTRDRFSTTYHKNHAWNNRFEPDTTGAQVLTDDLNPVDIWAERINREARIGLHGYFDYGLSW